VVDQKTFVYPTRRVQTELMGKDQFAKGGNRKISLGKGRFREILICSHNFDKTLV
jgi:hypothetical protein